MLGPAMLLPRGSTSLLTINGILHSVCSFKGFHFPLLSIVSKTVLEKKNNSVLFVAWIVKTRDSDPESSEPQFRPYTLTSTHVAFPPDQSPRLEGWLQ